MPSIGCPFFEKHSTPQSFVEHSATVNFRRVDERYSGKRDGTEVTTTVVNIGDEVCNFKKIYDLTADVHMHLLRIYSTVFKCPCWHLIDYWVRSKIKQFKLV